MTSKEFKKAVKVAKKKICKANKHIGKETENNTDAMATIFASFAGMGSECGVQIAKVARQIHPDALFIFPLYRGCAVIPKQEYSGTLKMVLYHDPHWMGHDEITTENLPSFKNEFEIVGQRSGQDYIENGQEVESSRLTIEKFMHHIETEAAWGYVKEKNPKATSMCIAKDVPKKELRKRMVEVFWKHVRKHLYAFRTKEDNEICKCGMPKIKCMCKELESWKE